MSRRSVKRRLPSDVGVDYATLAVLRYQIRRFLHVRETAARAAGIEPQQYLLLLQLKGLESEESTTIGVLAERLQVRHHSAVELIDRLVARRMVVRRRDRRDRRGVVVRLTPRGQAVLRRLALYSLAELETEGPALVMVLRRLMAQSRSLRPPPSKATRSRRPSARTLSP